MKIHAGPLDCQSCFSIQTKLSEPMFDVLQYSQEMPPRAVFGLRSNDVNALSDSATLMTSAVKGQSE